MSDDHADIIAIASRMGVTHDQMADKMLEPVVAELLRILPAAIVEKAFTRAAATARAKMKAAN